MALINLKGWPEKLILLTSCRYTTRNRLMTIRDKYFDLTPVEMCRLQTLPDDYLDGIAPNTAMSLAGNGWTVDVIAHLLRGIERR